MATVEELGSERMEDESDHLTQFGLEAIDLRWTLKDIAAGRTLMINQQHLAQLTDLGLVCMKTSRTLPQPGRPLCGMSN